MNVLALPLPSGPSSWASSSSPAPRPWPRRARPGRPRRPAWRGSFGGPALPGAAVIGDAAQWNALWRSLSRDTPAFDFTGSVAVVAYAGEEANAGYAVDFLEAAPQGDDLLVAWRILPPPPDVAVPQVLTRPWAVQAFPRPKGAVILKQVNGD